jgi:hypothetical protein
LWWTNSQEHPQITSPVQGSSPTDKFPRLGEIASKNIPDKHQ